MLFKAIRNLIGKNWLYTLLLGVALAATRALQWHFDLFPSIDNGIFYVAIPVCLGILLCYLLRTDFRRFRQLHKGYKEWQGTPSWRDFMRCVIWMTSAFSFMMVVTYVDIQMPTSAYVDSVNDDNYADIAHIDYLHVNRVWLDVEHIGRHHEIVYGGRRRYHRHYEICPMRTLSHGYVGLFDGSCSLSQLTTTDVVLKRVKWSDHRQEYAQAIGTLNMEGDMDKVVIYEIVSPSKNNDAIHRSPLEIAAISLLVGCALVALIGWKAGVLSDKAMKKDEEERKDFWKYLGITILAFAYMLIIHLRKYLRHHDDETLVKKKKTSNKKKWK